MTAVCIACHAKVKVRKLRGKAPCCGYYNCLVKAPQVRKERKS